MRTKLDRTARHRSAAAAIATASLAACASAPVVAAPETAVPTVQEADVPQQAPAPRETFIVAPHTRLTRDEETGTLRVTVRLGSCTSSSHHLVADTIKAWLTPELYVVQVTGVFTLERHSGPVKKDCSGHIKRVFVFEDTAPGGYRLTPYIPANTYPAPVQGTAQTPARQSEFVDPHCARPAAGETAAIDITGSWVAQSAPKDVYLLRSDDPGTLAYRTAGILGGGGIVPMFARADADGVFDLTPLGRVRFVSSSCAERLAPDGTVSEQLLRHHPRAAK